jgi:hypothetical protein
MIRPHFHNGWLPLGKVKSNEWQKVSKFTFREKV